MLLRGGEDEGGSRKLSRKKNLRRTSALVTAQTLYNLNRLAATGGYKSIGEVIDMLTRDHMLALQKEKKMKAKDRKVNR